MVQDREILDTATFDALAPFLSGDLSIMPHGGDAMPYTGQQLAADLNIKRTDAPAPHLPTMTIGVDDVFGWSGEEIDLSSIHSFEQPQDSVPQRPVPKPLSYS